MASVTIPEQWSTKLSGKTAIVTGPSKEIYANEQQLANIDGTKEGHQVLVSLRPRFSSHRV